MELKINQIPNRRVLASARSFYHTAQILKDEDFINSSIPLVVNSAFALELYLKSFNSVKIFKNGKKTKGGAVTYETVIEKAIIQGHNLLALYQELSNEIQNIIESEYNQVNGSFEKKITEYQNIFIDWRYIFEGKAKGLNITNLFILLKALDNAASKLEQQS